jgi:hypothetical protein
MRHRLHGGPGASSAQREGNPLPHLCPAAAGHVSPLVQRALDFGAVPPPPLPLPASPPCEEPQHPQQQGQQQQRAGSSSPCSPAVLTGYKRRREAAGGRLAVPPSMQLEQQRSELRDPPPADPCDEDAPTEAWSEACVAAGLAGGDAVRDDASSEPRDASWQHHGSGWHP